MGMPRGLQPVKHVQFLLRVKRIERELEQLINEAHETTPPTVEWVAMLSWASCARGALMGLAELGIPDSSTPLAPSPPPSPHADPAADSIECLFCTRLREPDSKFCERHKGGAPLPEDYAK